MSVNTAKKASTSKTRVRNLLKDRRWHTASEIDRVAGTPHGTRRARELRQLGYTVKTRRISGKTEYRVSGTPS